MKVISRIEFNDKDRDFYYYAQTLELDDNEIAKILEVK